MKKTIPYKRIPFKKNKIKYEKNYGAFRLNT